MNSLNLSNKEKETSNQFFADSDKNSGAVTQEISNEIEKLYHQYKKNEVEVSDVIICGEAGKFGHLTIYSITHLNEPKTLKYTYGSYEFVSIKGVEKTILWTDFSTTQPYNRQASFYVGTTFDRLTLVKTTDTYREFTDSFPTNVSFAVYPYSYNEFWKTVCFGICIAQKDEETFIAQLRKLLSK